MDNGELLARKQGALQACEEANQAYQEARQAYYMAWDELNQRVK